MQFSKIIVAAAAFALAQAVEFTDPSFNSITAGKAFNITWSQAVGDVTITLKNGPQTDLVTVSTIASGLTGTSYVWSVPSTLVSDTYALQIDDSTGVPNYSPQFQLIGGVSSSSSPSSTSGSSSSTGSSSVATVTSTSVSNSTTTSGSKSSASKTTSSGASSTGSKTTSATGSTSSTSAPSSASGLASPLAFVFLALAAIMTLN